MSHDVETGKWNQPPSPPVAAGDKPAGGPSDLDVKAEVSRTDSPGAGVSAAPVAKPAKEQAPLPANPAAATTAVTSEWSSALDQPSAPEDESDER
ncbi:MAG TPA: hypothetical protein VN628_04290 [Vicinamibacterales bacterium]|nr:hypothetical protein [Vicinamibacterales bacterium]